LSTGSDASSTGSASPYQATFAFQDDVAPLFQHATGSSTAPAHVRSHSNASISHSNDFVVDPNILQASPSRTHPTSSIASGAFDYYGSAIGTPISTLNTQSQFQSTFEFSPLPTSTAESLRFSDWGLNVGNGDATLVPPLMPPPQGSLDSTHKRHKHSLSTGSPATVSDVQSPYSGSLEPYSPYMAMPLTPNSSVGSDEFTWRTASKNQSPLYPAPDLRRMSVHSIINNEFSEHGRRYPIDQSESTTYGYDLGLPDRDTPNNDDFSAIAIFSPQARTLGLDDETPFGNTDTRSNPMAFERGGYYAKPVAIMISKSLGVLPPVLLENPMNLLYFHHFLNHTARILVPHDCEQNPFRQILPESKKHNPSTTPDTNFTSGCCR
jgi:hypothetical protein